MEFEDKVAVITGGASGIGRSIALTLARLGADIVIADIDDNRMKEVQREIETLGRRALVVHCDVTNNNEFENLATQTISTFGPPDILMNNAGIQIYGNFEKMTIAEYELIFNLNVLGAIRGVLSFIPHMVERGSGYILFTSSQAGFIGDARPYSISKYTLIGYAEGLHSYLRPKGIMVSVLCPGFVKTNLPLHSPIVGDEQDIKETREWLEKVPKELDMMEPGDLAQMVVAAMKEERFLILPSNTERALTDAMEKGRDFNKLENHLQEIHKGLI